MPFIGAVIYIIITPIGGLLADKFNDIKIMKISSIIIIFSAFLIFPFINSSNIILVFLGQIFLSFLGALFLGPINLLMMRLFPLNYRYTGISFSFSLGMGIFGGISPLVMNWLTNNFNNIIFLSFWISFCAIISYLSLLYIERNQYILHNIYI